MPVDPKEPRKTVNLSAAMRSVRALRDCTAPSLFCQFMSGISKLKEFGDALLAHPDAFVTIRHRREGDKDDNGNPVETGEGFLGTYLLSFAEKEVLCSVESWGAMCAAIEVLCLQNYVLDGVPGERELRIGCTSQDGERFFAIAHVPGPGEGGITNDIESNDLLVALLAEFCRTFALPFNAIGELRQALQMCSEEISRAN